MSQTAAPWEIAIHPNVDFSLILRQLYPDWCWNMGAIMLGRDALKDADPETAKAMLLDAISDLSEMHRHVLILSCGLDAHPPRTAAEVGAILGRSARAIQQAKVRALGRLRARLLLDRHVRSHRMPT